MKTSGLSWVSVALLAIGLVIGKAIDNVQGPRVPESDERAATSVVGDSTGDALLGRSFAGVDLIETREDIIYRLLDAPGSAGATLRRDDEIKAELRHIIDEVLKRDFATWPIAVVPPGPHAGGHLDSGGPSDTTMSSINSERGTAVEPGASGANLSGAAGAPLVSIEHRDYPTLTLEPAPSGPLPGYTRSYASWSTLAIDSVSYNKYRKPIWISHPICTVPGGSAIRDYPTASPPVEMLVFLGGEPCRMNCHEMWAVHRGATADWRNYVATASFRPGQPRTLQLYPATDEIVNVRCTWRSP